MRFKDRERLYAVRLSRVRFPVVVNIDLLVQAESVSTFNLACLFRPANPTLGLGNELPEVKMGYGFSPPVALLFGKRHES